MGNSKTPYIQYSATGNTFLAFDNRDLSLDLSDRDTWCTQCQIFDVDGAIFVEPATRDEADFRFRYINRDGGEVDMCGNGLRAITQFVHLEIDFIQKETFKIQTANGIYQSKPDLSLPSVLMTEAYDENKYQVDDLFSAKSHYFINTGVPHVVYQVEDVDSVDIMELGKKVRYDQRFVGGTNINIFQIIDEQTFKVRTYERGVEGETGSCGTGITAVAFFLYHHKNFKSDLKVMAKEGELKTSFDKGKGIWLSGPVTTLSKGFLEI